MTISSSYVLGNSGNKDKTIHIKIYNIYNKPTKFSDNGYTIGCYIFRVFQKYVSFQPVQRINYWL